jgi:hypothetical protein
VPLLFHTLLISKIAGLVGSVIHHINKTCPSKDTDMQSFTAAISDLRAVPLLAAAEVQVL